MLGKFFLAALMFLTVSISHAYPRHDPNVYDGGNLWSITFYNDASVVHTRWATQRICFLPYAVSPLGPTHIRGRWYSTSYPNWHGYYEAEGDSTKMFGNFWNGAGNDGINFDIVSDSNSPTVHPYSHIGTGHWTEWRDNGAFGVAYGFGNALLKRIGKCLTPSVLMSANGLASSSGEKLSGAGAEQGSTADLDLGIEPRRLEDGSLAEYPQQDGQVPLKGANQWEELFNQ